MLAPSAATARTAAIVRLRFFMRVSSGENRTNTTLARAPPPASSRSKRLQISAHAFRVGAEVAAAHTRQRPYVHAAPRAIRRDADRDVVLEAEQQRGRCRLDAPLLGVARDDVPAHGARRGERALERRRRRHLEPGGRDVGVAYLLLRGGLGTV